MPIRSRARGLAIIEQTATWHATPIAHMQASGRRRDQARPARAEAANRLKTELGWSLRMIGAELGCNPEAVRQLQHYFIEHELMIRQRRHDLSIAGEMRQTKKALSDAHSQIVSLERERRRLSDMIDRQEDMADSLRLLAGVTLYEQLMEALELEKPRLALVLAPLVVAYPRYLRWEALTTSYDHACDEIGYGGRRVAGATWEGATFETIKVSLQLLARIFAKRGWPMPVELGPIEESRRLTDACADFLNDKLGEEVAAGRAAYREQQERLRQTRAVYAKSA